MSNSPYPSSPITDTGSVIIYSPRTSVDDLVHPLSPPSSLKGIYVRSRPASMEVPAEGLGVDFGGFYQAVSVKAMQRDHHHFTDHAYSLSPSTVPDWNDPISTPVTSSEANNSSTYDEYVEKCMARGAAETRARRGEFEERHAHMMNYCRENMTNYIEPTSNDKTHGLMRGFSKKGDQKSTYQDIKGEGDGSNAPEMMKDQKKRGIPLVYRAVSKKVYGVFHRKTLSAPETIQVDPRFSGYSVNNTTANLIQEPKTVNPIKSSASLFTRKRRPTIDSHSQQEPKKTFSQRAFSIRRTKYSVPTTANAVSFTSTSLAVENRARLRHSVSFSGFVDLLELDDELDEATAEATQVASKTSVMVRLANGQGRRGCGSDGVNR